LISLNGAVEDYYGYPSLVGLGNRSGERCGFLWADDNQVNALFDELLHLRPLHQRLILCVFEDHPEVGMLGGGVPYVGVHLDAPGLP
jgi:hypothetical protein